MSASHAELLADFAAALRPRIAGDLRTDRLARVLYASDASMYQIEPLGVLVPCYRDDVLAAVEEAARFGLPVLARGSGTSLAGSAVGAALVIDTTRHLDRVVEVDAEARTVTVEPGVVLDHLNARLRPLGLMVGPDPASSNRATLGGMLGTNATGARSIRYGAVVDHLRAVEAVLPDGTPVRLAELDGDTWRHKCRQAGREGDLYRALDALLAAHAGTVARDTPRHWRRAGGYRLERLLDPARRNPAHLLCGSEGTLAVATELALGLVERPARTALGVAHFPSRRAALEAVVPLLATEPLAIELFDRIALRRAQALLEVRPKLHFVQGDPAALLIVEVEGATDAELTHRLDALERALGPGAVLTRCLRDAEIADVWAVRKVGLGLATSARRPVQALAFIEDAAVPVEHLADYVARLEEVLAAHGVEAVVYAHASAGCLHVRPFLDTRRPEDVRRMVALAEASADLVRAYGGALASEHGDGLARSWLAERFYGPALYAAYRELKRAFDPEGRFNPGRVVEAPPMTEHLRHPPGETPRPVPTELDWSPEGGFALAVAACNGQGVCRKRDAGTLCPPFMVTRCEQDTTRGRANALRAVLSGALPPEALTGPELAETMALCIGCKACKAECPAQVDLAAMKAEWLAWRWREQTPPLRTRLFAHLPVVSRRVAGPLAPAANRLANGALGRAVRRRIGITPERALPAFARRPFTKHGARSRHGDRVALFADTFARFHEPAIPRAAVRVLEAAGFAVDVLPYRCCGRTLLSAGFLRAARRRAEALVAAYARVVEAGVPVVGLEPSCVLTFRDELLRLLPHDARARALAQVALTFEEFVAAHRARFEAVFGSAERGTALLHPHCHQKALGQPGAGEACLAAAGFAVEVPDAGCCGMAGAFGYEAEHVALSRAMGERALAPAVRAAPAATVVVAAGTSCRAQVADLTGRRAVHPAEVLAAALPEAIARLS